jgi:hypothetical protein
MYLWCARRIIKKIDFRSIKEGVPPVNLKNGSYGLYDGHQSIGILLKLGLEKGIFLLPPTFVVEASRESVVYARPFLTLMEDIDFRESAEKLFTYFTQYRFIPLDLSPKQVGIWDKNPVFTDMEGILTLPHYNKFEKMYASTLQNIRHAALQLGYDDDARVKGIVKEHIKHSQSLFNFNVPKPAEYEDLAREYSSKLEALDLTRS